MGGDGRSSVARQRCIFSRIRFRRGSFFTVEERRHAAALLFVGVEVLALAGQTYVGLVATHFLQSLNLLIILTINFQFI